MPNIGPLEKLGKTLTVKKKKKPKWLKKKKPPADDDFVEAMEPVPVLGPN